MSPKRLKQTIMGGLIGALALWLALDRWLPSAKPAQAAAAVEPSAVASPPNAAVLIPEADRAANEEARERWTSAAWPANPFYRNRRTETAADSDQANSTEKPRYVLSAIVSGRRPLALINGAYLSVGDRLTDGSRIQSIEQNSVALQGPDGPWTLTFPE